MKNRKLYFIIVEKDGFRFISEDDKRVIEIVPEIEDKSPYKSFYCYLFNPKGKVLQSFNDELEEKVTIKKSEVIILYNTDILSTEKRLLEELFLVLKTKGIALVKRNLVYSLGHENIMTLSMEERCYVLNYVVNGKEESKFYDINKFTDETLEDEILKEVTKYSPKKIYTEVPLSCPNSILVDNESLIEKAFEIKEDLLKVMKWGLMS